MMSRQPENVTATVFLQLEPTWAGSYLKDANGGPILEGAKVVAMTQTRPRKQRPGTVLVTLDVRLPAGAFLPLSPHVVIDVSPAMTSVAPIEVTVGDASTDEPEVTG